MNRSPRRFASPVWFAIMLFAIMVGSTSWLCGQQPDSSATGASKMDASDESPTTFRANARLVVVDVVVTDAKAQPVTGLKASDFALLEDGRPQPIRAFEPHSAASLKPAGPPIHLPPHQYTNFTEAAPNGVVNIVLLDMLNTATLDQAYARQQMLQFLKQLPPGHRVALFTLAPRLKMIQSFTGDSDTLIAAANSLLPNRSLTVTSEAQRQSDETVTQNLAANASSYGSPGPIFDQMLTSLSAEAKFQENERVEMTLQSLGALARAVSGYAGRKNLLWLATDFPFRFGPDTGTKERIRDPHQYVNPLHETAALLAMAQVAVYPIDIGGLSAGGMNIATPSGVGSTTTLGVAANAEMRQATERWDTHEAMTDIARQTGGDALYGSNDIKDMLTHSIQRGENYYTLAYVPQNLHWNGEYRKIEVKVPISGLKLEYRRGYYALAGVEVQGDQALRLLTSAMQPSLPESTMLLFQAQVLPPDPEHKAVRIDYAVAPSSISFSDSADQRKLARVDFLAAAWDRDYKDAGHVLDTIDFYIRKEKYEEVVRTGLPAHQELELKPGTYTLRLGVMDCNTQKVGTVDVPLTIAGKQSSGQ